MLEHPALDRYTLDSLRTGTCGGAAADPQMLEHCADRFPIPALVQVYGQTESSTLVTCPSVDDPHRIHTAGHALDGCEVRIVDPKTHETLPVGSPGEIQVRGPIVMQGYWGMAEATSAAIDSEHWLHTGDLGRLTESGALCVDGGRLKDLIIRGGENIYPAEVEHVLNKHPCVVEAAVFGLTDRYYGEVVAAALRTRCDVSVETLASWCEERLAQFKTPSYWFELEQFPMTASGKIKKRLLREQAETDALEPLS
jgi:fatty-acyl-CoA synthase